MAPVMGSKPENKYEVQMNSDTQHDNSPKPKFTVGDMVCITKEQELFHKGCLSRWTEELYEVLAIQYTEPKTYNIKDMNGEEIKGTFYEQELQKSI